jgi:hypothetical protein
VSLGLLRDEGWNNDLTAISMLPRITSFWAVPGILQADVPDRRSSLLRQQTILPTDALVRLLLPYINGEAGLVREYRYVGEHRSLYSAVIRYEDLVHQSAATMAAVSAAPGS